MDRLPRASGMREYIGRLRGKSSPGKKIPIETVKKEVHKKTEFVTAADIFNGFHDNSVKFAN